MKTDDLIRALSADLTVQRSSLESRFAVAILPGLLLALALFTVTLGPRSDFMTAIHDIRFEFKFVITLLLALSSVALLWRLGRPGAKAKWQTAALLIVPLVLILGVVAELIALPRAAWTLKLIGSNAAVCLMSIPLFALPMLVAALIALRHGAPTRPGLTGAMAGLFAGAMGGAIYAAHCPDNSPLFVALWYSLAIAIVAGAGAIAGRLTLRW